jgi:predicted esterase
VVAACQKEGIEVLGTLGVPLKHLSYKGMGHSACNSEFEDLGEWLTAQIP